MTILIFSFISKRIQISNLIEVRGMSVLNIPNSAYQFYLQTPECQTVYSTMELKRQQMGYCKNSIERELQMLKYKEKTINREKPPQDQAKQIKDKSDLKMTSNYLKPNQSWTLKSADRTKRCFLGKKIPSTILIANSLGSPLKVKHLQNNMNLQKKEGKQYFNQRKQEQQGGGERTSGCQLPIHERLYLQSRKRQVQKLTEQLLEEQYFKKEHPFHPTIGEKSLKLAKQKFKKQTQKKTTPDFILVQNTSSGYLGSSKADKLFQYSLLSAIFEYLSEGSESITNRKLFEGGRLYKLPLPIISQLQPILKIIRNNNYELSWSEFLSVFNNRCRSKASFLLIMRRFMENKKHTNFYSQWKQTAGKKNQFMETVSVE